MKATKIIISVIFIFMSVLSYSNSNVPGIFDKVVSIKKVQETPDKYRTKEIKIKGVVTKSASFLMKTGYIVKDESGEIFVVVSGKMPPKIDSTVTLKGKLVVVGSLNDKNYVYFKENNFKDKEEE